MDVASVYRGGNYQKKVDLNEIKKMIKNMKKAPIIKEKSDIYHQKEEQEAEKLISKIDKK